MNNQIESQTYNHDEQHNAKQAHTDVYKPPVSTSKLLNMYQQ